MDKCHLIRLLDKRLMHSILSSQRLALESMFPELYTLI
jgi:hypothetical protein